MTLVKQDYWRSKGDISQKEDMVRVIVDMTIREWHDFKQRLAKPDCEHLVSCINDPLARCNKWRACKQ